MTVSIPTNYRLNVTLRGAFGNLYRQRHVLIAAVDPHLRVLLAEKDGFYPAGIYRLPGGGVEEDEDFGAAARREMAEELGVAATAADLSHLADITVEARTGDGDFTLVTRLFGYRAEDVRFTPGSDVSRLRWLTFTEVEQLAQRLLALPDEFWYDDGQGYRHRWGDYGKVYGPLHRWCMEAVEAWVVAE